MNSAMVAKMLMLLVTSGCPTYQRLSASLLIVGTSGNTLLIPSVTGVVGNQTNDFVYRPYEYSTKEKAEQLERQAAQLRKQAVEEDQCTSIENKLRGYLWETKK